MYGAPNYGPVPYVNYRPRGRGGYYGRPSYHPYQQHYAPQYAPQYPQQQYQHQPGPNDYQAPPPNPYVQPAPLTVQSALAQAGFLPARSSTPNNLNDSKGSDAKPKVNPFEYHTFYKPGKSRGTYQEFINRRHPGFDPATRFTYKRSKVEAPMTCKEGLCTDCRIYEEYDPNMAVTRHVTQLCQFARLANIEMLNKRYALFDLPRPDLDFFKDEGTLSTSLPPPPEPPVLNDNINNSA